MAFDSPIPLSRRAFLRAAARLAALGGLAWLGRNMASRAGTLPGEPCPSGGACGGCPRLPACGLPRGQTARNVLGGGRRP